MFDNKFLVNVQLEDSVPETSIFHSKYWTKYGGKYSQDSAARYFINEYAKNHREFDWFYQNLSSFMNGTEPRTLYIYHDFIHNQIKCRFTVMSIDLTPIDTGLATPYYYTLYQYNQITKTEIEQYINYYMTHKNPVPYGFEASKYSTTEKVMKQIIISDFSDMDKILKLATDNVAKQKNDIINQAKMFDILEQTNYKQKIEDFREQIAQLNKMRNDFKEKTIESIQKMSNLQGDF